MLVKKKKLTTNEMTKVAILSVMAFLIMFIETPLWFTPEFLKIDLSDIPALIGAFALGPMIGVIIELVKNMLNIALTGTITGGIGELANFLIGSTFVYTAAYIYHKNKSLKSAVIGMLVGSLMMTIIAALANYYILIPMYAKIYGAPVEYFVELGAKLNSLIVDFKSFIFFAIVPFNIFKGVVVSIITIPLYKRISPILHK